MKLFTGVIGALGLGVLAWSGAWFYGKGAIRDGVDEQIALLREQGIEVSYNEIEIGGFPFGYDGRITGPRYAMTTPAEQGGVSYHWEAPWIGIDVSAGDLGGLSFSVPETQTLLIDPPVGGQTIQVVVDSDDFRGRVSQAENRPQIEGQAGTIRMTVSPVPGSPVAAYEQGSDQPGTRVSLSGVTFSGAGPATEGEAVVNGDFDFQANAAEAWIDTMFGGVAPGMAEAVNLLGTEVQVISQGRAGRVNTDVTASNVAMASAQGGAPQRILEVQEMTAALSSPALATGELQKVAADFSLKGVTPEPWVWQNFDPRGGFPREINELSVDIEADTVLTEGGLSDPQAITIRRLFLDGLGLELDGEAEGRLIAGQPEGAATLRLTGVPAFIDSAVAAGLMPAEQAVVYKLVVENFAGRGEKEGQRVFTVVIREGQVFVNNMPVGPAPALPR